MAKEEMAKRGRGRPPKALSGGEAYSKRVQVRLLRRMSARLSAKAYESGQSVAEYVRGLIGEAVR